MKKSQRQPISTGPTAFRTQALELEGASCKIAENGRLAVERFRQSKKVDCVPALKPLNDRIGEGVYVLGSNAGMKVEPWGNTCRIVRELLSGATVDECMAAFDALQDAPLR